VAALAEQGITLDQLSEPEVQLNGEGFVKALDRVRALYKSGALFNPYSGAKGENGSDPQQLVREGRVAMWEQLNFGPEAQIADLPFEVGRVGYPADQSIAQILGVGGEGYMISGGTAYPQESWKWIEFLSRQPIQQGEGPDARVPARAALADASGFWSSFDEQGSAAYQWALEHSAGQLPGMIDYAPMSALGSAVSQAVADPSVDTKRVLADAQRQLEDMRAQVSTTPTPTPDTRPVLVATPEPQEAPPGATTIEVASWGVSPSELRQIARAFRQQRPDIFVNIRSTDTFTSEVFLKDVAAISDCFMWSPAPTSADAAALLDLRPLIDADPSFASDDFAPALLSVYTIDGGIYGLPYTYNVRTLTYNRSLFDEAGLPPPAASWGPDEFLQAAQALSSGEGPNRRYGYVPLGGPQNDLFFFVSRFGGRLTTGTGLDTRPTFTDPKTVEAIRWFLDLDQVHKVVPSLNFPYKRDQSYEDHSFELIQAGQGAMWFDYGKGSWGQGPIKEPMPIDGVGMAPTAVPAATFEAGIAPLLVGTGGLRSADLYTRGWSISKNAKSPQACWEFIKFATGDTTLLYGEIPARTSLVSSEAFAAQAPPDRAEIVAMYAEIMKRPIENAGADTNNIWRMDLYWFFQALSNTIDGKGELQPELERAQKTTTTYMECVARGEKPPACALEADPDYQGYNIEYPDNPVPKG
jgi:ABC-type glycerol-3-phosphate transport system substrate-binding protein